jgi:hypothetical protein
MHPHSFRFISKAVKFVLNLYSPLSEREDFLHSFNILLFLHDLLYKGIFSFVVSADFSDSRSDLRVLGTSREIRGFFASSTSLSRSSVSDYRIEGD